MSKIQGTGGAFAIHAARFRRCDSGGFAIMFSLLLIPLILAAGMAIDYTRLVLDNYNLQEAVDSAAFAAVLPNDITDEERTTIANKFVKSNYKGIFPKTTLTVQSTLIDRAVSVEAIASIKSTFMSIRGMDDLGHNAVATAKSTFLMDTCILALNPTAEAAISIKGSGAHITTNCGVHSNSVSASGIVNSSNTISVAKSFCSSGGYTGSNFNPAPKSNCSQISDPYASLPPPPSSGCDQTDYKSSGGDNIISPGVYCGGMNITKGGVKFNPGTYVIKDGDMKITTGGAVTGEGVTFYFVGNSHLAIAGNGSADLSAPTTGDLRGMLFMSHPDAGNGQKFKITGNGDTKLVGISYFPNQLLDIGGNGSFGATSPFMGIVADTIQMHGNGQVEVNFDYKAAGYEDIPLPGQSYTILIR